MPKLDPFSLKRLQKFIDDFRENSAILPTLRDLEGAGFSSDMVRQAVKQGKIVELYLTLTSGAIVKGYKSKTE